MKTQENSVAVLEAPANKEAEIHAPIDSANAELQAPPVLEDAKLTIGGVTYSVSELQRLLDTAKSQAGRGVAALRKAGICKEVREMGGGFTGIITPALASKLKDLDGFKGDPGKRSIDMIRGLDKIQDGLKLLGFKL